MAAATTENKGTAWLVEQIKEKTGKDVAGLQIRTLLRKMAADGDIEKGEGRWNFKGLKDPAVVAVIKAVKNGDLEAAQKEKLSKLKSDKAEKPAGKTSKKAKVAAVVEDEPEEEAPVKKTRTRKPAAAKATAVTPAKKTRSKKAAAVADDDEVDLDEL